MKSYKKLLLLQLILLVVVGCSKRESIPNDHGATSAIQNKSFFDEIGAVRPYRANSPFADAMSECIYADNAKKSCTVSKLPLLGISKDIITVDDILERTMISHQFLGNAFRAVLLKMNPEILQMFGSVNSIVISDRINPSFYFTVSGTIYLSGRYFWSNTEELEIVSQAKDERDGYGESLQFVYDYDYIKNKKSISARANDNFRTYDEMLLPVVRVLIHELTHANDYFPRSLYRDEQSLDLTQTYQKIAYERYMNLRLVSDNQPSHLSSEKLKHLGKVLFHGESAKPEDNLLLATDVADEFKKEIATDFYSFSSTREDLAMNMEESLMLYYFDAYRIVIVIKYPNSNFVVPKDYDYPIVWGQKGRVLIPEIKDRALYAVENILGEFIRKQASAKFENLAVKEIPENASWEDVLNL